MTTTMAAVFVAAVALGVGVVSMVHAAPFGVHMAFGGAVTNSTSSMTVSWLDTSSADPGPVLFGLHAGSPDLKALPGQAVVAGNQTFAFHASLEGLVPGATYYFSVPGDAPAQPRSLKAPPARGGDPNTPFTMAVIGDMGISGSENTMQRLMQHAPEYDWLLHVGDYAYSDEIGRDYEASWDEFFRQIEGLSTPYATLPGNHDVACHDFGAWFCPAMFSNATVLRARFRPPYEASGSLTPMHYSFDYLGVHFVMIDTETSFPGAPEGPDTMYRAGPFGNQLEWLEADLARANLPENRALRPWVVVAGHRPTYSSELSDFPPGSIKAVRSVFEPLFLRHKVDLYLTAHVHAFESNYPAANGVVTQFNFTRPAAPVSVVNGAAGNIEGHDASWKPASETPWLAYRNDKDYGYAMLSFHNTSALTYSFYSASTDQLLHSFTLEK